MKNKFFTLWLAGLISGVAVLPYVFTLQNGIIQTANQPLYIILLASIVQTAVLLAITVFFGLKLSRRLRLSIIDHYDSGTSLKERLRNIIVLAVPLGAATGLIIIFGDKIFSQYVPELALANNHIVVWKTLLASLYGGIVEEILMRLFLVSLFAWLGGKIFRSIEVSKNNWIMWGAIIASSILFGIGHLPLTSSITHITPIVVARAITLNGIGGLIFGWLYWKKGLVYAMATHFITDILLLVILPVLLK